MAPTALEFVHLQGRGWTGWWVGAVESQGFVIGKTRQIQDWRTHDSARMPRFWASNCRTQIITGRARECDFCANAVFLAQRILTEEGAYRYGLVWPGMAGCGRVWAENGRVWPGMAVLGQRGEVGEGLAHL